MLPWLQRRWPLPLFVVLACVFLWPVVFSNRVFVPAGFLKYLAPWSATASPDDRPPWNPLMYDSVGQFYPWRKFASDSIRSGTIPLWNPYQFCGTPFVANSQSAVFFPPNVLYYILPVERAAGLNAILHLVLAASFMWLLLRELGASNGAGTIAGITFAFSTWEVSWLHLPTFLATSCWLPLVLVLARRVFLGHRSQIASVLGLGVSMGLCLLAGHLQVAFYVLLAASILPVFLWLTARRLGSPSDGSSLAALNSVEFGRNLGAKALGFFIAYAIAGMVAAPQLLPTLELSCRSHRTGPPTSAGYEAYTAYAVSTGTLATLFAPDFFGNPSIAVKDASSGKIISTYAGQSQGGKYFNYAEGAMYVGLLPLSLAAFAVIRRRQCGRLIPYFATIAIFSLLMALGTPIDALLYFHVPGFGQSGSPGRALVLWTFAIAALAGLGYEKAAKDDATPIKTAVVSVALVIAMGAALVWFASRQLPEGIEIDSSLIRQAALLTLSSVTVVALCAGKARTGIAAALPFAVVAVDLFAAGINYNATSKANEVYPGAAAIDALKQSSGHDRIMPLNNNWSFAGPTAVLPPNGAMVFGLRDVQGYDSLFPGQYKAFMNRCSIDDASPLEVGNMVFAKTFNPMLHSWAGVRVVASLIPLTIPGARERLVDGIFVYELGNAASRVSKREQGPEPATIHWLEDGPTRVRFGVESTSPLTLFLLDERYPGWHCLVDGAEQRIEAHDIFRKVAVPSGKRRVDFVYRPSTFQVGVYLSLVVLLICSTYAALEFSRGFYSGLPASPMPSSID